MANAPGTPNKGKDDTRTGNPGHGPHTGGQGPPAGRADEGMMGKARDTATAVMDKAKDAASAAAGTIRESAPREGMIGRAGSAVADTLETGGRYLEEEGLSGMMDDLSGLIRRNPLPALLLGIGLGFLLARVTRS